MRDPEAILAGRDIHDEHNGNNYVCPGGWVLAPTTALRAVPLPCKREEFCARRFFISAC
jgi:hypothetical protein